MRDILDRRKADMRTVVDSREKWRRSLNGIRYDS